MFKSLSVFKKIFLLSFLFFFAGCANMHYTQPSLNVSPPKPAEGVVTLLLTNNTSDSTYAVLSVLKVADENNTALKDFPSYSIGSKALPGTDSERLFSGALTPGRYRITEFSLTAGNYRSWLTLPNASVYVFTVEAGKVTDLGRMIHTKSKANQVLSVRAPNEASVYEYLDLVYPTTKPQIDTTHPTRFGGWRDPIDEVSKAFYKLSKLSARDFNHPNVGEDATIVAGTRLGGVLKRSPTGRWKLLDTGENHTVQSVTSLSDGRTFAASDLNNFYVIDELGISRKLDASGIPLGKVVFSHQDADIGLLVGLLNRKGLSVYSTKSVDDPSWKLLQSIDREFSFFLTEKKFVVDYHDRSLYLGRGSSLYRFDLRTQQWQEINAPFNIVDLKIYNDKWVARGESFLVKKSYISMDSGSSWLATNTQNNDSMMHFDSSGDAFVISSQEGGMIKMSKDMGKSWRVFDSENTSKHYFNAYRPIVMTDDDKMLMYINSLSAGGSSIVAYDLESKSLITERTASLTHLLDLIQRVQDMKKQAGI